MCPIVLLRWGQVAPASSKQNTLRHFSQYQHQHAHTHRGRTTTMESSAGWRRRQRPLRNLCLFASLRRSRAMMEAQHQRLAATLSAAPAPPPLPPIPVLTPAPQEQQQQQYSKHSPAAEEEPAEHHYQGSQEVRRERDDWTRDFTNNHSTQESRKAKQGTYLALSHCHEQCQRPALHPPSLCLF